MLYVVLILVLAALGALVTALITAESLWAWVSVGVSVCAGVVLLVEALRRRSKGSKAQRPAEDSAGSEEPAETTEPTETAADEQPEQTALLPAAGELSGGGVADGTDTVDVADAAETEEPKAAAKDPEDPEPGVEETDAADALVVAELDVEVVVVDEHPRYHLPGCGWLGERDTIPIELAEARELGFTPCARCTPDATLAAAHRQSTT
ncbi:hypothetical protein [Amycolatopsis aidingensis]|uniref:hypothetical protein n=1 Tax=Amycolatopsis aidingensis TaxID=2842453 RepID=UPI001C0CCAFF|nr:hypothetical protein [Amycolatopsis aidingensis]